MAYALEGRSKFMDKAFTAYYPYYSQYYIYIFMPKKIGFFDAAKLVNQLVQCNIPVNSSVNDTSIVNCR